MFRRLVSTLRRRRAPAIWRGIWSAEARPPLSASRATSTTYATASALEAAERLLHETQQDPMPYEAALDHHVLALVARLADASPVAIADMGGGVGQSYAALRRMLPRELALRYRVMELPEVVERGRAIWSGNGEIEFAPGLDVGDFPATIVFSKGVLQYFDDYRAHLRSWFGARARWVLLEKLSIVSAPTYLTMQVDVYGQDVPYWMFHIDDITAVARECGYAVALQRRLERRYDQSDFPPELRMERATSLLFERIA